MTQHEKSKLEATLMIHENQIKCLSLMLTNAEKLLRALVESAVEDPTSNMMDVVPATKIADARQWLTAVAGWQVTI